MTARQLLLLLLLLLLSPALLAARANWLDPAQTDWLVQPVRAQAAFNKIGENLWRLSNGLIHRDFIVSPNFATVDFYSTEADTSLLRAFSPEATVRLLTITRPPSPSPASLFSRPARHGLSSVLHPQGRARCLRKSPPTLIPEDDDDDDYEDDDDDSTVSSQTTSHPDTWDHGHVQLQLSWQQ